MGSRLEGKTAWITGAARGIGRAIAITFAREGANLLLTDICQNISECPYAMGTLERLEHSAAMCREIGRRVAALPCDVRAQARIDDTVRAGLMEFGKIDVQVNNAGIVGPGGKSAHLLREEEWAIVIDVDLNGAWRCARAVLPHMVSRREGSILNIASTGGLVGFQGFASYVAAKHGVIGLTKALAIDYAARSIRVNCICPTSVQDEPVLNSEMLRGVAAMYGVDLEHYEEMSRHHHPLGTLIRAEDVAWACVWLASDESRRVTGTTVVVDAGFTAR